MTAIPCRSGVREGLDSGRYAPSVLPLTPDRLQPTSGSSALPPFPKVCSFRLPKVCSFRLPLTVGVDHLGT